MTSDERRLTFGEGGTLKTILFGLPFLCGGLLLFSSPWWGSGQGNPTPRFVFGGAIALVGAAIAFGRAGAVVDRASHQVTTWWGLLVPFHRSSHPLEAFQEVVLARFTVKSGNSVASRYSVSLRGETEVTLTTESSKGSGREHADRVAAFLGLPLSDETGR